jgi:endonuclease-3 related protein
MTTICDAYRRMQEHYGALQWWPGETPFEVMVGAILTQNTAWTRVEVAIENIRSADLLDPKRLRAISRERLSELIRPSGTFRVKAAYLRSLLDWLVTWYDGDVASALAGETMSKREELLAIKGVGRETADSILCYAGGHAIFVVDAYTRRIAARHGWLDGTEDYDTVREWFEERLPNDAPTLNEHHAQIVNVGKDFCHARTPRCEGCPLAPLFDGTE